MVPEIEDNQPAVFVSSKHIGILVCDTKITAGELVKKWTGGHENYSYSEKNGITTLTVEIDTLQEYKDYFTGTFPLALEKLDEICEN